MLKITDLFKKIRDTKGAFRAKMDTIKDRNFMEMWVWVNSGSWWWTGRPGVLRFTGSQRVGHDWATELNRRLINYWLPFDLLHSIILHSWTRATLSPFIFFLQYFFPNIFVYFLIFFYFTILYWFCHTLTWICHKCLHKHSEPLPICSLAVTVVLIPILGEWTPQGYIWAWPCCPCLLHEDEALGKE